MGSIDPETLQVIGVCIKCQACIRFLPHASPCVGGQRFPFSCRNAGGALCCPCGKHVSFVRQRAGELVGMVLFCADVLARSVDCNSGERGSFTFCAETKLRFPYVIRS